MGVGDLGDNRSRCVGLRTQIKGRTDLNLAALDIIGIGRECHECGKNKGDEHRLFDSVEESHRNYLREYNENGRRGRGQLLGVSVQPDGCDIHGIVETVFGGRLDDLVFCADIGVGQLKLNGYLFGNVEIADLLGGKHLKNCDVLVRHEAVVNGVVFPTQRAALVGKGNLNSRHSILLMNFKL